MVNVSSDDHHCLHNFEDDKSLFNDEEFCRDAQIDSIEEVRGKEVSLKALRATYKNLKKTQGVMGPMRTSTVKKWL
jgi:hypothetical protein